MLRFLGENRGNLGSHHYLRLVGLGSTCGPDGMSSARRIRAIAAAVFFGVLRFLISQSSTVSLFGAVVGRPGT